MSAVCSPDRSVLLVERVVVLDNPVVRVAVAEDCATSCGPSLAEAVREATLGRASAWAVDAEASETEPASLLAQAVRKELP